jgi:hypothetical protein
LLGAPPFVSGARFGLALLMLTLCRFMAPKGTLGGNRRAA